MVANWRYIIMVLVVFLCFVTASEAEDHEVEEGRGKKKKIALFIYFADLILKKVFVLKLIYAFVFWIVLHKAGYFLGWFASYLKDQKKNHHEHHEHYIPHHHYDYGPQYGPYRKEGGI